MKNINKKLHGAKMIPIQTILIISIIFLIAGITRMSLKSAQAEDFSDSVIKTSVNNSSKITSNKQVINMLTNIKDINNKNDKDNTLSIFKNNLKNYFSYSEITLNNADFDLLKVKICELIKIINIEHQSDFTKMSLDGRAVSIDIAGNIYKLCGLKLITNMDGEIEQITDLAGNTIYNGHQTVTNNNFQFPLLISVLGVLLLLFILSIIVVKKNNIFQKDDYYDEFNEKRYA